MTNTSRLALATLIFLSGCTQDTVPRSRSGHHGRRGDVIGGDALGGDNLAGDSLGGDPTGGDSTGGDPSGCSVACAMSTQCPDNQWCVDSCCEPLGLCTPGSCDPGHFCDATDGICKSATQACAATGCSCWISEIGDQAATSNPDAYLLPAATTFAVEVTLLLANGRTLLGAASSLSFPAPICVSVSGSSIVTGASSCAGTLTAQVGSLVTCTAELSIQGPASGGHVAILVVDEMTGGSVDGAQVVLDYDGTGTDNGGAPPTSSGVTHSAFAPPGSYDLTVFADGYDRISYVGVSNSISEIIVSLPPSQTSPRTGAASGKVDFEYYEERYLSGVGRPIRVALVNTSFLGDALLSFDFSILTGPITDADCAEQPRPPGCYPVEIPPYGTSYIAIPSGLVMGTSATYFKGFFDSPGPPGQRYVWGLGGEFEFNDVADLITSVNEESPSVAKLFRTFHGLWYRFASGLRGNLTLTPAPMADWESYQSTEYTSRTQDSRFPWLDSNLGTHSDLQIVEALHQFTDVAVPVLPADPAQVGQKLDTMVMMTGVDAPGAGLVALGLSTGFDCTVGDCLDRSGGPGAGEFDGVVNGGPVCLTDPNPLLDECPAGVSATVDDGHLGLFHAPAHGGLEGSPWLTIMMALALDDPTPRSFRGAALVRRGELGASADWSAGDFPDSATPAASISGRQYSIEPITGVDLQRVDVTRQSDDSRWRIYFPNVTATFTAPTPPDGPDPMTDGANTLVSHATIDLQSGSSLEELWAFNGSTMANLFDRTDGYAVEEGLRP